METTKDLDVYQIKIVKSKTDKTHIDASVPLKVKGTKAGEERFYYIVHLSTPEREKMINGIKVMTKPQGAVITDTYFSTGDTAERFSWLSEKLQDPSNYRKVNDEVIFYVEKAGIIARIYDVECGFVYEAYTKDINGNLIQLKVNQIDPGTKMPVMAPLKRSFVRVIAYEDQIPEVEEIKAIQRVLPFMVGAPKVSVETSDTE